MKSTNSNPNIKIVSPRPVPRRRRISRWLTLAAIVVIAGGGLSLFVIAV